MMSNTCLSFIIPLSPVSLVWSMLQAPGLAGVALFGSDIFGSAIAVDVTPSVADATTSVIVVISFLFISPPWLSAWFGRRGDGNDVRLRARR
jgi:hypothetical protein